MRTTIAGVIFSPTSARSISEPFLSLPMAREPYINAFSTAPNFSRVSRISSQELSYIPKLLFILQPLVQSVYLRVIFPVDPLQGLLKIPFIISMCQEIALFQHFHPGFTVVDQIATERFLYGFPGKFGHHAFGFQVVFQGFPGQLEGIFKTLYQALF